MDGYLAMVQVRGLTRGHTVRFAMQVACVPATIVVVYAAHAVLLGADGTSWWARPARPAPRPPAAAPR